MESVRLQSDAYKSKKSPSDTQMQTSGEMGGTGWGGHGGTAGEEEEEERTRRREGRAAGEVIITSQPHSLSNVFKGETVRFGPFGSRP